MKVLHLTRDFPPRHHGGISTAVGALARASVEGGMAVAVVSFDDWRPRRGAGAATAPAPRDEAGIAVLRVQAPADLDAARGFAAAHRPDLLHVHHAMLWDLAAELRSRLWVPAVLTVHVLQRAMNALRGSSERTLSLAAEEAALASADRIIAPSRAVAAALAELDRVRLAPPGSDPPLAGAGAAREPSLLSVGRFDDVKGTPELFEAIPHILAALPGARFTVAGGVPANRRAERRWLARWERDTTEEIRSRTSFAGWLAADPLASHYAAADVVVVPSRFETFGQVVLEAMRHGVAVAATAAGGVADLVADGETGLLSPVGDVAGLVANAVRLGREPELRSRLGRAAAERVRRDWVWTQRLPAIVDVYREVI